MGWLVSVQIFLRPPEDEIARGLHMTACGSFARELEGMSTGARAKAGKGEHRRSKAKLSQLVLGWGGEGVEAGFGGLVVVSLCVCLCVQDKYTMSPFGSAFSLAAGGVY